MIRKLVAAALVGVATLGVVATPAQAAVIRCTTYAHYSGNSTNIRIASNYVNWNRVHSYVVYRATWFSVKSTTYSPYGPVLSIGGRYTKVRSWQSGTECKPWIYYGDL